MVSEVKFRLQACTDGHQHTDYNRHIYSTYWTRNCIWVYSVPGFLLGWQLIKLLFKKKITECHKKTGKRKENNKPKSNSVTSLYPHLQHWNQIHLDIGSCNRKHPLLQHMLIPNPVLPGCRAWAPKALLREAVAHVLISVRDSGFML